MPSSHKVPLYDDQFIVITGAAGFIGSCVVRYLNDLGYKNLVLVDDFEESNKWKNLVKKNFIEIISKYDLFDWLEGKEQQIAAFIHLGACSDTTAVNDDYLIENNYRFSVELASYALKHSHRFIYASSAATYGNGSLGFNDDESCLDSLEPLNMYAFSKQLFDLWLKNEGVLNQVVGLKYFNVFGPNEAHKGKMASMVYHMVESIKKDGLVRLFASNDPANYKDGEQARDFIYVKDAVKITCDFLQNDMMGIYNVGSGKPSTWNQLALAVFQALEQSPNIHYIPMPVELSKQYQNYTCADLSKYIATRKEKNLSEIRLTNLEDGVGDYIKNYLISDARW